MDVVLLGLVELHDRGLGAVAVPRVSRAVLPPVEAGLVNPLVVLPPQHEGVLLPHEALADAQPHVEAGTPEVVALGVGVEHVERRAGLHRLFGASESRAQELAELRVLHRVVPYGLPVRSVVVHVVRRIGEPAVGLAVPAHLLHVIRLGGVAAEEEVPSEDVHLARLRDGLLRHVRRIVGVGLPGLDRVAVQELVELGRVEPHRTHVEAGLLERLQLRLEQVHVPRRHLAGLVVGDPQGAFLLGREVVDDDRGDRVRPHLLHRLHACVAVDDHLVLVDDDRADEPVLADRRDHARHGVVVVSRVLRVRLQIRDLQVYDLCHSLLLRLGTAATEGAGRLLSGIARYGGSEPDRFFPRQNKLCSTSLLLPAPRFLEPPGEEPRPDFEDRPRSPCAGFLSGLGCGRSALRGANVARSGRLLARSGRRAARTPASEGRDGFSHGWLLPRFGIFP